MSNNIINRLNKITETLNSNKLAHVAYQKFLDATPVRTGNAKNNTNLKGNSIEMNYNYGHVLDQGRGFRDGQMRGSTQAPKGMTEPTIKEVRDYIYQQTGIKLKTSNIK